MNKAFLLAVVGAGLVGCGVSEAELNDETLGDDSFELSTTKDTFLIARRDTRRCVAPLCGGFWVKDLNSTMQEKYVSGFDFSQAQVPQWVQDAARGAPDHQLVLFGRLGPKERTFDTRTLVVQRVFRGMPGKSLAGDEKFYGVFPTKIACATTPCAYLQTTRLNRTTGHTMATDVDVSAAQAALVDQNWLLSRSLYGRSVLAGKVVRRNGHVTVTATQVFVELPDRLAPCQEESEPSCGNDEVAEWTRTPDRCTVPTGVCITPRYCALYVPSCEAGYRQVSWSAGCTQYACEPEFLEE